VPGGGPVLRRPGPVPWRSFVRHRDPTSLAELGELRDDELATLHDRAIAAELRIGTDRERVSGGSLKTPGAYSVDAREVELWEAVKAALAGWTSTECP
jgi:hypothetical protein